MNFVAPDCKAKPRGKALVCYLARALSLEPDHPDFFNHSNRWECREIVRKLNSHGFSVDIIDFNDTRFRFPSGHYDLVLDVNRSLEHFAPWTEKSIKIFHATGAHWLDQKTAELNRLKELRSRRGKALLPRRDVTPSLSPEIADFVTSLGSRYTRDTYSFLNRPILPVQISSAVTCDSPPNKDCDRIRKNFLWFGSTGLVHKGLDLVLEAFACMPHHQLTICGPIDAEPDFVECYKKELYETPNIKTIGWVDIRSQRFQEILSDSIGLVYPSCSEGGGGSAIDCMRRGIVPILTYEASVELQENEGILLRDHSVESIIQSVTSFSELPASRLSEMSEAAFNGSQNRHSRQRFSETFGEQLDVILSKSGW